MAMLQQEETRKYRSTAVDLWSVMPQFLQNIDLLTLTSPSTRAVDDTWPTGPSCSEGE